MTEHTPWTIGKPSSYHAQHYTPIKEQLMGSIMTDVCWVVSGEDIVHLIAAAPDLLEALEALVYEVSMSSIPDDASPVVNAREVIRKAKGDGK